MKFNLDKEIEQAVNFYAKDGEREMLEAAIRGLIEKAKAEPINNPTATYLEEFIQMNL